LAQKAEGRKSHETVPLKQHLLSLAESGKLLLNEFYKKQLSFIHSVFLSFFLSFSLSPKWHPEVWFVPIVMVGVLPTHT
jgi:hypothetical protein